MKCWILINNTGLRSVLGGRWHVLPSRHCPILVKEQLFEVIAAAGTSPFTFIPPGCTVTTQFTTGSLAVEMKWATVKAYHEGLSSAMAGTVYPALHGVQLTACQAE